MEAGMPVTILGATGSVGRAAIDVCEAVGLHVTALAGRRDAAGMEELVRRVRPGFVGMEDEAAAQDLRTRLRPQNPALYFAVQCVLEKNKAERHLRGGAATKAKYQK